MNSGITGFQRTVGIYGNGKILVACTFSGYRDAQNDFDIPPFLMPADVSTEDLGIALETAILKSRRIDQGEIESFYDPLRRQLAYNLWIQALMDYGGYTTKRGLLKHMKVCILEELEDEFRITPLRHEKLDAWGRLSGASPVVVPASSDRTEIGNAALQALTRAI